MAGEHRVALDANCVTFYMEAMWDGYDPAVDSTDLAPERAALLRSFLFTGISYTLLPTARLEYEKITDPRRLESHRAVSDGLMLDVVDPLPDEAVVRRAEELSNWHAGPRDCRMLAEAEFVPVPVLLTYDKRMLGNLAKVARGVVVSSPSDYWKSFGIARGTVPELQPHPTNPLRRMSWWREVE